MKFQIDRRYWLRGEGGFNSRLLRLKDMKMCCVGFFCITNGLGQEEIAEKTIYGSTKLSNYINDPFMNHPRYSNSIYDINDEMRLSDHERERLLEAAFKERGHEVEFIN